MEDRQELRQLQIVQIFLTKERRNLINEPDGKLLLASMAKPPPPVSAESLRRHIGTDSPVETMMRPIAVPQLSGSCGTQQEQIHHDTVAAC